MRQRLYVGGWLAVVVVGPLAPMAHGVAPLIGGDRALNGLHRTDSSFRLGASHDVLDVVPTQWQPPEIHAHSTAIGEDHMTHPDAPLILCYDGSEDATHAIQPAGIR